MSLAKITPSDRIATPQTSGVGRVLAGASGTNWPIRSFGRSLLPSWLMSMARMPFVYQELYARSPNTSVLWMLHAPSGAGGCGRSKPGRTSRPARRSRRRRPGGSPTTACGPSAWPCRRQPCPSPSRGPRTGRECRSRRHRRTAGSCSRRRSRGRRRRRPQPRPQPPAPTGDRAARLRSRRRRGTACRRPRSSHSVRRVVGRDAAWLAAITTLAQIRRSGSSHGGAAPGFSDAFPSPPLNAINAGVRTSKSSSFCRMKLSPGVVRRHRVGVAVFPGLVGRPREQHGVRHVADVESEDAQIPVGHVGLRPVVACPCAMAEHGAEAA